MNNFLDTETIVAIATAPSNSAISIIRLSGSDAIDIANSVFNDRIKDNKVIRE